MTRVDPAGTASDASGNGPYRAVRKRRDRALLALAGWVLNRCSRPVRYDLVAHIRAWRPADPLAPSPVEPLWPNRGWDHGDMCDANGCRHGCCPCIGEPYCQPSASAGSPKHAKDQPR
jgi:hypothetical protein